MFSRKKKFLSHYTQNSSSGRSGSNIHAHAQKIVQYWGRFKTKLIEPWFQGFVPVCCVSMYYLPVEVWKCAGRGELVDVCFSHCMCLCTTYAYIYLLVSVLRLRPLIFVAVVSLPTWQCAYIDDEKKKTYDTWWCARQCKIVLCECRGAFPNRLKRTHSPRLFIHTNCRCPLSIFQCCRHRNAGAAAICHLPNRISARRAKIILKTSGGSAFNWIMMIGRIDWIDRLNGAQMKSIDSVRPFNWFNIEG